MHKNITKEDVEIKTLCLQKELIDWMNGNLSCIGCVSKQLVTLFENSNPWIKTIPCLTRCGIDDDLVKNTQVSETKERLKVLYSNEKHPLNRHSYDAKRVKMVHIMEERCKDIMDFIYLPKSLSHEELDQWYDEQKGDIILCTSHSEGNPFCLMESKELVPITTNVGIVCEMIVHKENGFIVEENESEEQMVEEMIKYLHLLNNDRELLFRMKQSKLNEIKQNWMCSKTVASWDEFFDLSFMFV